MMILPFVPLVEALSYLSRADINRMNFVSRSFHHAIEGSRLREEPYEMADTLFIGSQLMEGIGDKEGEMPSG